jgi:two-component system response regulator AtoC
VSDVRATFSLPVASADLRELVTIPERVGAALLAPDLAQALALARAVSGRPRAGIRLLGRLPEGDLPPPQGDGDAPTLVTLDDGTRALRVALRVALSPDGGGLARAFGALTVGPVDAGAEAAEEGKAEALALHVSTLLVERALARRGGVDRVTGLLSRPAFERGLPALTERIGRGEPVAAAILDLDRLRAMNAAGGPAAGDEVLAVLGAAVSAVSGSLENACRWGGDEVALVLPGRDAEGARQALGRVAEALRAVTVPGGPPTFAAGVACAPAQGRDAEALLFHADQALAHAKREGAGRVVLWDDVLRGSRGRDRVSGVLTGAAARDYRNVQALLEAVSTVSNLAPLDETLAALLERVVDVTGAERGLVLLREGEAWRVAAARGRPGDSPDEVPTFSRSAVENALKAGRAVHMLAEHEDAPAISPSAEQLGLRAVLCAPLTGEDVPAGAVYVDARDPRRFDPPTLAFFDALVASLATALRNAALYDRLRGRADRLAQDVVGREAELARVRRRLERSRPAEAPARGDAYVGLVGASPVMQELFTTLRSLEGTVVPVIIEGESGTGKELVARAIHTRSPRTGGPLVVVNCGAIPENLVEAELFGHMKGAFTGAHADRAGLLENADGGTLFLDELGELPLDAQAKLLRVLESGEVRRVGATQVKNVDVRVIAATNRDLKRAIAENAFREDLFYRLAVFRLRLPPLRERPQDVPRLVAHLLSTLGRPDAALAPSTMPALVARRWPGNVRELRNVLERALALAGDAPIGPEHVAAEEQDGGSGGGADPDLFDMPLQDARALFSLRYAKRAIERAEGSVPEAARRSGVSRQTFYRAIADGQRVLEGGRADSEVDG